jgi:DNA-binding PadR family transcriptional regulator
MSDSQSIPSGTIAVNNLTAFQQNILVILARESMYGLAIKRHLESYYNSDVNHGRLYPNLDDLVEAGYIEKGELDKRTNQYTLTDQGYEAVLERLEWVFSNTITDEDRAAQIKALVDDAI